MRLDEADVATLNTVRVQCLGKEYPATKEAWDCMEEVAKIGNKRHGRKSVQDEAYDHAQQQFLAENRHQQPSAIETMLGNFGIHDSSRDETPKQRVERFYKAVNENAAPKHWYTPVTSWLGF